MPVYYAGGKYTHPISKPIVSEEAVNPTRVAKGEGEFTLPKCFISSLKKKKKLEAASVGICGF